MSVLAMIAAMTMAHAAPAVETVDVAYEALAAGENAVAINEIETNANLDREDPARLINLGIAHARQGNVAEARALFRKAIASPDRYQLETASGRWVDSRNLARQALANLMNGAFVDTRMAQVD